MNGKLVVFEGIDGAGTETQSKMLVSHLKSAGAPAERIFYPDYEGYIGKVLSMFQEKEIELPTDMQFLLYAGDMVKDRSKLLAWLGDGRTVVCDRYFNSTIAYQGPRGFDQAKALRFASDFGLPKPDVVFLLRISPEESAKRKMGEKGRLDRNEEDLAFLGKVNAAYERMAEANVFGRWFVIDGERPKGDVFRDVLNVLEKVCKF